MPEMTITPKSFLEWPVFHWIIVALVATVAYSNTFQVPFVFDDELQIIANPVVTDLAGFLTTRSGYEYNSNRFIGYLTFALNYHVGGLNVVGYHAVNLAIHITNALLVYTLVRFTFRTPFLAPHASPLTPHASLVPFFAALLFVCHPVQTQAVTYIVKRLTSLATLFYLASVTCHVRWRLAWESGALCLSRSVLPFWLMSLAAALLAMKTKEFAVTLPLAVLLFEWCFFGRPDRRVLLSLAPLLSTIFIIPLGMVSLHEPIGRILSDVNTMTVASSSLSRWEYLCTQFSVIVTYLRLLVLPVNQNLDYDYPVNHSLFEPRTFLPLILLMALLAAAVMLWRAGSSPESRVTGHESRLLRLAAFGIFWFFLTLLVESSIVPIHDVIFEHRLYLPSVGFLLALTALVMAGSGNLKGRIPVAEKLAVAALIIAAGLLATATYSRNRIWRDPITLWQDVKAKSPNKVRPYNILGTYYAEQGRVADAIREFEMSVRLKPTDVAILDLLAQSYLLADRQKDAEAVQKSLERVDPLGEKLQESLQKIENLKRIQR